MLVIQGHSKCPSKFPNLYTYPNKNHGDVCRNEVKHGYNVGWVCPQGCITIPDAAPYCEIDGGNDFIPCRINSKIFYIFQFFSYEYKTIILVKNFNQIHGNYIFQTNVSNTTLIMKVLT